MKGNGNSNDSGIGINNFASYKKVAHEFPINHNNNINTSNGDDNNNNADDENIKENNNENNSNKRSINCTNDIINSNNQNDESNNNINNMESVIPTTSTTTTTTTNNNNNNSNRNNSNNSNNYDSSCSSSRNVKNNNNNNNGNANLKDNKCSSYNNNKESHNICNNNNKKNKNNGNSTDERYTNKSGTNKTSNVTLKAYVTNNCNATMDRNSADGNNIHSHDNNNSNKNNNMRNGTKVLLRCGNHGNNYNVGISEEGYDKSTGKETVIPLHANNEKNVVEFEKNENSEGIDMHRKNISTNYNSGFNFRNTKTGNSESFSNHIKMRSKSGHENGSNMYSNVSNSVEGDSQATNANMQIHNKTAKNEKMNIRESGLNQANNVSDINSNYNESTIKLSLCHPATDVNSFKQDGENNVSSGTQRFNPLENLGNEKNVVNYEIMNCSNSSGINQHNTVLEDQHNKQNKMKDIRSEDNMNGESNELNVYNRFGKNVTENVNLSRNCSSNNDNVSKSHGTVSVNNRTRGSFKNRNTSEAEDFVDPITYSENNRKRNTTIGKLHGTSSFHKSSTSNIIITKSGSNFSRGSIPNVNTFLTNYSSFSNRMNIEIENKICHKI